MVLRGQVERRRPARDGRVAAEVRQDLPHRVAPGVGGGEQLDVHPVRRDVRANGDGAERVWSHLDRDDVVAGARLREGEHGTAQLLRERCRRVGRRGTGRRRGRSGDGRGRDRERRLAGARRGDGLEARIALAGRTPVRPWPVWAPLPRVASGGVPVPGADTTAGAGDAAADVSDEAARAGAALVAAPAGAAAAEVAVAVAPAVLVGAVVALPAPVVEPSLVGPELLRTAAEAAGSTGAVGVPATVPAVLDVATVVPAERPVPDVAAALTASVRAPMADGADA
ncbi:hypothetical protein P9139_13750 [Curtobacterium flaccumfaciens]|nr:hypothetical protein P9139_13750 [Curtobacterium flaccumfaciens]